MILFYVCAALISAALAALILARAAGAAEALAGGADPAQALHRRQLAEIDDLQARGLMPEGEVKAVKAEAARRLLASAERPGETALTSGRGVVLGAAIGAPLLAAAIYMAIGAPGVPDQPFQARAAAWRANPLGRSPAELAAALAAIAPQQATNVEFWRNLTLARLLAGENPEAEQAARQALKLSPQDPGLWSMLGRARLQGQDPVPPQARAAFEQALQYNPDDPYAQYYVGEADIEAGQPEDGLAVWRVLLAKTPPGEMADNLTAQIAQVEKTGKFPQFQAPPSNAAQAAAAAGVDVNAMVSQLAAQLKASPNDPDGWVQLVRAYAVLGDKAKLDDALSQSRKLFAGKKDVLTALDAAAAVPPQ